MPDNRDAIVDAVVGRMQQIRVANGYLTDAGQHVFRWRSADLAPTECPAIDVRDPDRRPLGIYSNVVRDWAERGARYVFRITVDQSAKKVTFWGQANQKIVMPWSELRLP